MTTIASATATFTSWDEDPSWEGDAPLPRLAQATVAFTYSGQTDAEGDCRYVLSYAADGSGHGVGFERLSGSVDGRPGEVVLRHDVTFAPDGVAADVSIVDDSGTGVFEGRSGRGHYDVAHGAAGGWNWSLTEGVEDTKDTKDQA